MVDVSDDCVALMQLQHNNIINASSVSMSEFKADISKLVAQTHEEAEAFMLMLKDFTNIIFLFLLALDPSTAK